MLKLSFENISEYYFLTSWTFSSFSMNASIWGHQYLFAHILLENTIFPLFWRDGRFILKNCKSCYNSEKGKVRYPDYQFIDKFFNQPSNCREQKSFEKIEPFNWCQRYLTGAKNIERLNWILIPIALDTKYVSRIASQIIIVSLDTASNGWLGHT